MNFNFSKLATLKLSTASLLSMALTAPFAASAQSPPPPVETKSAADNAEANSAQKSSSDSDWRISLGGGVISSPRFIGANKQRTIVIPFFDIRYQDWFFVNPDKGIGVQTKPVTGLSLTAGLGFDGTSRESKYDSRLNGLPKVGATAALKLGAEYEIGEFKLSGELTKRLAPTEKSGTKMRFEAGYGVIATKSLLLTAGVFDQVMDKTYAHNFLSITPAQSTITGLKTYEAKRGPLDGGAFVQAVYRFDDEWTIFSKLDLSRLANNAADSPIVQKKNQTTGILFITRSF
jgi:MipA family protein